MTATIAPGSQPVDLVAHLGPDAPILEAADVSIAYGERTVVAGASLRLAMGERIALVGPNGAGKSTLVGALTGVLRPSAGAVRLCGTPMHELDRRTVARVIAVVPELAQLPFGMPVEDVVALGRLPHEPPLTGLRDSDRIAVEGAMERVGITHLRTRDARTLSMGERQLVFIALALAQEAAILVLDEPTVHLDIRHQVEILELLARLHAGGTTVIAVLHDLAMAGHFFPRVAVIDDGRIVVDGPPVEALDDARIRSVFGVDPGFVRLAATAASAPTHEGID